MQEFFVNFFSEIKALWVAFALLGILLFIIWSWSWKGEKGAFYKRLVWRVVVLILIIGIFFSYISLQETVGEMQRTENSIIETIIPGLVEKQKEIFFHDTYPVSDITGEHKVLFIVTNKGCKEKFTITEQFIADLEKPSSWKKAVDEGFSPWPSFGKKLEIVRMDRPSEVQEVLIWVPWAEYDKNPQAQFPNMPGKSESILGFGGGYSNGDANGYLLIKYSPTNRTPSSCMFEARMT